MSSKVWLLQALTHKMQYTSIYFLAIVTIGTHPQIEK